MRVRSARVQEHLIGKVCGRLGVSVPIRQRPSSAEPTGNVPNRTRAHGVPLARPDPLVRLLLRAGGGRPTQAHDQLELRHERGQPHLQPHALGLAGAASVRTTPPLPSPPPTRSASALLQPFKNPHHLHQQQRRRHHHHHHTCIAALTTTTTTASLVPVRRTASWRTRSCSVSLARSLAARRSSSPRAPRSIRTCTWRIASLRSHSRRSDPAHHASRAAPAAAGASAGGHRAG